MKKSDDAGQPDPLHRAGQDRPARNPTRVLIVDDHPVVIAGCRALLAHDSAIVITEAADAESGAASFVAEPPDVCVIDINLPGVSDFELARRILGLDAAARIVIFSINDDPIFAARAIEIGAKGYVSKSGDLNDLIAAIREVMNGGVFLPASIARSLAFAGPIMAANRLARLTPREIEILRLIGAGKSLAEIAQLIRVSYKTVANTSSVMRHKLGVHSTGELVRLAIQSKLAWIIAGSKAVARIAGQREEYLLKALHDYKSNVRIGGGVAAMVDVTYPLSEEEITALAHYLAHL